MSYLKKLAIGLTALVVAVPMAHSATQGTVGATSTGSLLITAPMGGRVKISFIDDLDFSTELGAWDGSSDVSKSDDLCVWSNTGGYNITATGSGAASAFLVSDGVANNLAYSVDWNDVAGTDTGAGALAAGSPLGSQGNASSGATCGGGGNLTARVIVTFGGSDLGAAAAATYTGTLTMTVAPE